MPTSRDLLLDRKPCFHYTAEFDIFNSLAPFFRFLVTFERTFFAYVLLFEISKSALHKKVQISLFRKKYVRFNHLRK